MTRRVVLYELNEVPLAVLRRYADRNPASGFAPLLGEGAIYETVTPDQGHLGRRTSMAYAFDVRDSFADGPDTHPAIYQSFQSLNLTMTRGNSRNVLRRGCRG